MVRHEIDLLTRLFIDIDQKPLLVACSQFVGIGLIVWIMKEFPRSLAYGPLVAKAPLEDIMRSGRTGRRDYRHQAASIQFRLGECHFT